MNIKRVEIEQKRLENLLERADVPQQQRDAVEPIIENLAWMRGKLEEAREQLQDANIVCHYNNGGGQEGERESPFFKSFLNLWRGYLAGMEKFLSCLPKELQDEAKGDCITVLEQVQKMKKKVTA